MCQEIHNSTELLDALSLEVSPGIKYVYDDTYLIDPNLIERDPFTIMSLTRPVYVTAVTPKVAAYNAMCLEGGRILAKLDFDDSAHDSETWVIPDLYKTQTMQSLIDRLLDRQDQLGLSDDRGPLRVDRIHQELTMFCEKGLIRMLNLMCYVVDTLEANNQVWGVGRGSSVSSYVLFLIGVHDVDSVKYDLDFADFVRS